MSHFTHLCRVLSYDEHKRRHFEECWFHCIFLPTIEVNGDQQLFVTSILQNILFCVHHIKKTYTVLEQHEGGVNDDEFFFLCELFI